MGCIANNSFTPRGWLKRIPTMLDVVAAALIDQSGRVLMQQRRADRQHGGLWEFPGGKLELGETASAGLLREIEEELGLVLAQSNLVWVARAQDPGAGIVINLYTCRRWAGIPLCLDAQEIGWFTSTELDRLAMPPLDRPLAEAVKTVLGSAN